MIKLDQLSSYLKLITFISCFCLSTDTTIGQSVSASGPIDSLTVGEIFNFSITIKNSVPAEKVIFPDSNSFYGDIEFLSSSHFKVSSSTDSTEFNLQFFGVEDASIPPLPIRIVSGSDTTLIFTDPYQLFYKQTIGSENDELKPLKPNFAFPRIIWPYLVGLLVLLATGLFIWWKFFRSQDEQETETRPIPEFKNPLDELEAILIRLKEEHTGKIEKDFKWFYSELGDAIRWYIEELYKIPALESTTREVLRYMDAFGVDVQMIKHTRTVLNEADMAKFAKFKPTLDESWNAYKEGLAFMERAKAVDSMRIHRMKREFENQYIIEEETDHAMG